MLTMMEMPRSPRLNGGSAIAVLIRSPSIIAVDVPVTLGGRCGDALATGCASEPALGGHVERAIDVGHSDRSIEVRHFQQRVVRSVIDVTSALGLTSVAEGVEQQGRRAALDALGCDYMQGYLFAEPAPPAATGCALRSLRRHHLGGISPA